MSRRGQKWIDLDTDALPLIRAICDWFEDADRVRPITLAARQLAKYVIGIRLEPANKAGLANWSRRPGWEERLERFGIDPRTRMLVDQVKWEAEVFKWKHQKYEKYVASQQAKGAQRISKLKGDYQAVRQQFEQQSGVNGNGMLANVIHKEVVQSGDDEDLYVRQSSPNHAAQTGGNAPPKQPNLSYKQRARRVEERQRDQAALARGEMRSEEFWAKYPETKPPRI